jgi:hypothetical protein
MIDLDHQRIGFSAVDARIRCEIGHQPMTSTSRVACGAEPSYRMSTSRVPRPPVLMVLDGKPSRRMWESAASVLPRLADDPRLRGMPLSVGIRRSSHRRSGL